MPNNLPHLVIDARLYGPTHTGLGRYTKNLLLSLIKHPDFPKFKWTLIIYPELSKEIKSDLGGGFNYVETDIRHYSLSEQVFLPLLLNKLRPSLVHFTHFNKPLLYRGRSVVTIHDLIKHFSKGPSTTTRLPLLYWPKYLGYLIVSYFTIKSSRIIVPSNFWRKYIIDRYQISPNLITTTYESVDPKFLNQPKCNKKPQRYLLYTGNLYPHKNVPVILKALTQLPDFKLYLISAKSAFTNRLQITASDLGVGDRIKFLGFLPDEKFRSIYSKAFALVHPSFLEGFSLTGLEAMALGCPVISSNSSCLPEIYGQSTLYFDPANPSDLVKQIRTLDTTKNLRQKLLSLGYLQVKKYSWDKTANLTLSVYQSTITSNAG